MGQSSNCRALVPHQRQFSDEQIKVSLNGILVGIDAWMMAPSWQRFITQPYSASEYGRIIEHLGHCQLAGNTRHVVDRLGRWLWSRTVRYGIDSGLQK